ncbi:hypothetical protein, conserved [Leishmania tarentolae]|uniref:Uncharacterized protein n=1 Tax=Leishmania tarentolae TaxID=5689 RepID=A0A640KRS6_LEITA|nr:hypothetical protein, conserved [Leishmania tarentolae]
MSLFDIDDSHASTEASSSSGDEGVLPPSPPPPPPRAGYSCQPSGTRGDSNVGYTASLSVLEQRRRMAELDADRRLSRGGQWRNVLLGTPASAPSSFSAAPSSVEKKSMPSNSADVGKFGNSIAAALKLRREEKEKTLLKRLQQQRKAEEEGGGSQALMEKDMEVGVFVTASYKALLQRNLHAAEKRSGDQVAQPPKKDNTAEDEGSGDDDDGPLATYLRQLEGTRQPATARNDASLSASRLATGDYYERIMKAPLLENNAPGTAFAMTGSVGNAGNSSEATPGVTPSAEAIDAASLPAPTLDELQDLIEHTDFGPSTMPGSLSVRPMETEKSTVKAAVAAETEANNTHSAVLAHAQLLFDTRQAKSCSSENAATLVAAARRCDGRIGAFLFASLP